MKRVRSVAMAMTLLMALSLMGCGAAGGGGKVSHQSGRLPCQKVKITRSKQDQEILLN